MLPKGLATPNHHLFNILKGEMVIGYVWLKVEEDKRSAFLYEIFVNDKHRCYGVGTKTMRYIEEFIQQKGVYFFKLHVFGSNTGARKLYENLGFEIAGVNMLKLLE
ncbi:GNAT family N-acetyltransferase [Bacillus salitolerans]|uniref:GNAT family N-acetyltransferase n=1 Tax=Bacillus salitolerans TaxID=1437434 RepID=A0ABW4LWZ3_9BACI